MMIVLLVFVLQVVTALIVVFFLNRHFHKELTILALEKFETLRNTNDLALIKEIVVSSADPLEQDIIVRIKSIVAKRFNNAPVSFTVNSAIQGGVIIFIGDEVIDFSAKTRLKYLWGAV